MLSICRVSVDVLGATGPGLVQAQHSLVWERSLGPQQAVGTAESRAFLVNGITNDGLRPTQNNVMAASFMIARYWEQAKWPSISEGTKKLCYSHAMEYDSMVKIIKSLNHRKTWRKL